VWKKDGRKTVERRRLYRKDSAIHTRDECQESRNPRRKKKKNRDMENMVMHDDVLIIATEKKL
jgi:hypothetical protein